MQECRDCGGPTILMYQFYHCKRDCRKNPVKEFVASSLPGEITWPIFTYNLTTTPAATTALLPLDKRFPNLVDFEHQGQTYVNSRIGAGLPKLLISSVRCRNPAFGGFEWWCAMMWACDAGYSEEDILDYLVHNYILVHKIGTLTNVEVSDWDIG